MTNFFQYKLNKKYLKYFLILGWVSIWASLSINPMNIFSFYENIELKFLNTYSLLELINVGRATFQILYFIILLVSTLILLKTKKKIFKFDIIFILFLLIFLIEIISLFKTDNSNTNIFFTICSLNTILTVFLLKNFFSEVGINLIFKLSIILLIILLIFFGIQYIFVFFHYHINFYGAWATVEHNLNFQVPRPTGLSRTALIIFIVLSNINIFKKPFEKINYLIMTLSIILLLLLSSRTSIFLYFIYILFYILYFKIYKLKNFFMLLKNFILIPLVSILAILILQNIYQNKFKLNGLFNLNIGKITRDYPTMSSDPIHNSYGDYTTGRLGDWKEIVKNNKNFLLGNGVLGDRYLINQSASNLLFYKYSSSGMAGVMIIIFISLITLFHAYKNIFVKKSKYITYKFISSLILIALMLRSILETSYGIFGIDFILFCICFSIIIPNKKFS